MPPHAQTEFAAFLARADVSQAAFARLTGLTPRQVNNWARGRATVPTWAAILAVLLQDHSPEALTIAVEEARQEVVAAQQPSQRPVDSLSAPWSSAAAPRSSSDGRAPPPVRQSPSLKP